MVRWGEPLNRLHHKEGTVLKMTTIWKEVNPFPWYREMREHRPVWKDPETGVWHVFRYEDVKRVLSDYRYFSSCTGDSTDNVFGASMLQLDPPRHRQLRSLVSQAFTPRAIRRLEPRIREIAIGLLEKIHGEEMDIVQDFAYPLPVIVIAELLGVPPKDRERFKLWSDVVVAAEGPQLEEKALSFNQVQQEMVEYFLQMLEERRQHPQEDLISGLLAVETEGEHLSDMDLLGFCALLLVAGNETTTNLIANAFLCFDEEPPIEDRLRQQPKAIPHAVEEVLRHRSPVKGMSRRVTTDTELGGETLGKGEYVFAWIASANRDDNHFPDGDRFDIDRDSRGHIAFGHGVHFCLGAPLARLEAVISLEELLRRFSDIPNPTRDSAGGNPQSHRLRRPQPAGHL